MNLVDTSARRNGPIEQPRSVGGQEQTTLPLDKITGQDELLVLPLLSPPPPRGWPPLYGKLVELGLDWQTALPLTETAGRGNLVSESGTMDGTRGLG